MKLILLSDIHVTSRNPEGRKDQIINSFKTKFSFVLKYAQRNQSIILQAGDFFDRPRDWHILYLMIRLLTKYKIPIFTVFGQHDTYMSSNRAVMPTTTSILNKLGLVRVLTSTPIAIQNIRLWGCSWGNEIPKPTPGKINVLVAHAPITTKEIYPGHNFTAIQYFIKKHKGWNLILLGDIHIQSIYNKKKGPVVVNAGPMLRLARTTYNMAHHPCFFIYDTKKLSLEQIEIPHLKAKDVFTQKHIHSVKNKRRNQRSSDDEMLVRFARIIKEEQKMSLPTLREILYKIMAKQKTSRDVRNLLIEVIGNDLS